MANKTVVDAKDGTVRVVPLSVEEENYLVTSAQNAANEQAASNAKQQTWENAVNAATTIAQLKAVILNNLRPNK